MIEIREFENGSGDWQIVTSVRNRRYQWDGAEWKTPVVWGVCDFSSETDARENISQNIDELRTRLIALESMHPR